jgi:hypothetical protein
MAISRDLICDGCGQTASAEHIARRLQRLEWTTRYRPVHINALLLGAFSPQREDDFLYAPGGKFSGEAAAVLDAVGISTLGKTADTVHAEFQRAGFFLTHILECPAEESSGTSNKALLTARLQAVAVRIRRSLKPKRVVLVSKALEPVLDEILALDLGCPIITDSGRPFDLDALGEEKGARLRDALSIAAGA